VLVTKRHALPDADARDGEAGKMEKYFSEAAGEGG
jgi:ferredoxin